MNYACVNASWRVKTRVLRRALIGLDALRERYANFFERAPIGYVVLSDKGVILEANFCAADMLGIPRRALDDQPLTRFVVDEQRDAYRLFLKSLFATGELQVFQIRLKQQGGTPLWVRLQAVAARNQGNGARICLAAISDVTKSRKVQAGLERRNLMAKMDVLAGGLAHEINNPLTFVLHNMDRLLEDLPNLTDAMGRFRQALRELIGSDRLAELAGERTDLNDPVALAGLTDRAKQMSEGMLRIRDIVGRLSAFSCGDQEGVSCVNLNHAVEQAIALTTDEMEHRIVIRKDLGRLPEILASDSKLVQVFKNLIINAAQATDEGKALDNSIDIRTWADSSYVFAEVMDTGRGISPEHLNNVFEPFFTTTEPKRGCGLGLAATRRIVSNFNGEIRAESTVGEGTRFLIQFPIGLKPSPSAAIATASLRGRILVVDDEALVREVIVSMLEKNHEIVTAKSGRAAKNILETDAHFDLILCDLMMPEVSGIELHSWLAIHLPLLARRLVFMTGGVFTLRTDEYLERVSNIVVYKPFKKASLSKLVNEQLLAARGER